MEVPQFPLYIRSKDKTTEKASDTQNTELATSTVGGGASSVVSGYSGTSEGSNTTSIRPVVKSLLADMGNQQKMTFGGRGETGKIKFHMRGAINKQTPSPKAIEEPIKGANQISSAVEPTTASDDAIPQQVQNIDTVTEDENIAFHIEKLGRSFSLAEAQNHQQHMNNDEFERFLELQDRYLNFL